MDKSHNHNPEKQLQFTKYLGIKELNRLNIERFKRMYPSVPEHAISVQKYTDKTSNGLTKCIIDFINLNGYQAERVNSMGRQIDELKIVKDVLGKERTIGGLKWIKSGSKVGTADISATIKGRSVKIEVKCKATGDNYQSPGQIDYQLQIERAGGVYVIARTFEGFYNWYKNFIDKI